VPWWQIFLGSGLSGLGIGTKWHNGGMAPVK